MSLKNSGLLFVLCVSLVAINGLALNGSSEKTHTQDLHTAQSLSDKSQAANGVTTESVKIILPNTSEIISKSNGSADATTPSTAPPTTTTVSTSTTTAKVTTPSTPASTLTPTLIPIVPTPVPVPDRGDWVVRNKTSNMTCIIAGMAMQLNITYPSENEKEVNAVFNIPKNATGNGTCNEPNQSLTINWGPGHILRINFSSNKTAKNFFISELSLDVNATVFKNAKDKSGFWHFKNTSSEFATPLEMSYKCNKIQDVNLESEDDNLKAVLSLKDTQFEAFMNKSKAEFGAAQDCDTFDTPDIVPIAVGCALAILVLVVLVAYLIGRKRSQNQGYLSM